MGKHEHDDGRPADDRTHQQIEPIERRRRREALANRIGLLLAKRWLRMRQHGERSPRHRKPPAPKAEKTEDNLPSNESSGRCRQHKSV